MLTSRSFYQSSHNEDTGHRVESTLQSFDPAQFQGINARAFYGIVELSGVVTSSEYKQLAMQIAYHVTGVSAIVESIMVIPVDCVPQPRYLRHSRSVAVSSNPAGHAL